MTSRDLAGVTRDKTENGEFCLLPAVLFFFSVSLLLSRVEGKRNKANI